MIIHPWNRFSQAARALRKGLRASGVECYVHQRPAHPRSFIVNWGANQCEWMNTHPKVLNRPEAISVLTNKLRFFEACGHDKSVVPWTTDPEKAKTWEQVYVRERLEGSGGDGIVLWNQQHGELPAARLYTKRVHGTGEYRIHIGRTNLQDDFQVLDTQKKVCPRGTVPKTWAVRSHDNGFIFIRGEQPPGSVCSNVCAVARTSFPGLHFGAFDVIHSEKSGKSWILEGNSAPGLEGKTVDTYVAFIKQCVV